MHHPVDDLHWPPVNGPRIGQPARLHALSRRHVELPVMERARDDAAFELPLCEGCVHVTAAILDGVDFSVHEKQGDRVLPDRDAQSGLQGDVDHCGDWCAHRLSRAVVNARVGSMDVEVLECQGCVQSTATLIDK